MTSANGAINIKTTSIVFFIIEYNNVLIGYDVLRPTYNDNAIHTNITLNMVIDFPLSFETQLFFIPNPKIKNVKNRNINMNNTFSKEPTFNVRA